MELPEFHTQHVLIIDENENNRALFLELIAELPWLIHVSLADGADDGIKTLKELDALPDVIFIDMEMTDKDGLECLQEIKSDNRLTLIPVVIFSKSSFPSVVDKAYAAGAHLYVTQSDSVIDMKNSVRHVLSVNWKERFSPPPREEFLLSFREPH